MNRPNLIEDWQFVLRKAWSVRLIGVSCVLSAAEFALPFLPDTVMRHVGQGRFAAAAFLISALAGVARFVAQERT